MLSGEEPGKQRPRSCRTQELARSSGPRKCVAEKGWLTELGRSVRYRPSYVSRQSGTEKDQLSCAIAPGSTMGLDSSARTVSGGWLWQMRSVSAVRSA
jgi:hypothetical protein